MLFTNYEMTFLQAVTGKSAAFGLKLFPIREEEREQAMQDAVRSLMKKRVLNEESKLTKLGGLTVRMLEWYQNAEEYLVVNGQAFAWCQGTCFVTVLPKELGFDLCSVAPWQLMGSFLVTSPYLREAAPEDFDEETILSWPLWLRSVQDQYEYVLLERYRQGKRLERKAYYVSHGNGYVYELLSEKRNQISSRQMRTCLMQDLHLLRWGRRVNA